MPANPITIDAFCRGAEFVCAGGAGGGDSALGICAGGPDSCAGAGAGFDVAASREPLQAVLGYVSGQAPSDQSFPAALDEELARMKGFLLG